MHPRLLELAEVFFACRVAFFETCEYGKSGIVPGSASQHFKSALDELDPAGSGVGGFALLAEAVSSYLLIASGHLGGLAALHASGEVIFPTGMLTRAVIENSARAMWILGTDADAPQDALARAYLEDLLSAEEAKKNAGRLGSKSSAEYQDASTYFKALRGRALEAYPGTTVDELGRGELAGQKLLRPEAGVEWMYDFLHEKTGSSIDARTGLGVYGFLSNMTHPTLYPVRQLTEWTPPAGSEPPSSSLKIDVAFLERQASVAVVAFYNALSYVTSFYGWPSNAHDRLTRSIDRFLPGIISPG